MLPLIARARTLGVSMALATAGLGAVATIPAYAEATTWDIQVGAGNEVDTGLNRFYPSDITIHRGDTVSFAWRGGHTVTFNPRPTQSLLDYFGPLGFSPGPLDSANKFVSGVPMGAPGTESPPFNVVVDVPAGKYHFQCMLHQFMHGSITVKNGTLPRTNGQNKTLAHNQITADTNRASALDARLTRGASHSDGEAIAGAGDKVVEFAKFYPTAITVHVGDELTFTDRDLHEPHTVSFGPIAGDPQLDPTFGVFPSGPGNPKAFDGTSALNSGFLLYQSMYDYWKLQYSPVSAVVPRHEFSVTFTPTAAGKTINFYCALHGRLLPDGSVVGMSGHITVLAAENGGGD
jgi:plastocyanin